MHTPLLARRTFTDADNKPDRRLIVIDDLLAKKAFRATTSLALLVQWRGAGNATSHMARC
jgi:hypothetical protein